MAHILPDQNPGRWDKVAESYETAFQPITTFNNPLCRRSVGQGIFRRYSERIWRRFFCS